MDDFQRKELVTRRSLKYAYYVSPDTSTAQQHTLLFLHGFPDSAHLWAAIVANLHELPYKIIIPDCLGYGGTDKPPNTELFAYKDQAEDLYEILGTEDATSTIIIGHDWGSTLAQRTYLHKRELFSGVVLLNAAYVPPSAKPFDLAAVNTLTEELFGYPQFAYWNFFLAPDAAGVIESHLERMWQVLHGDVDGLMKKLFCVPDAMRNFLLGSEELPLKGYAIESQARWKERFMDQFKEDGFHSALQMYRAITLGVQDQSDLAISEGIAIDVPLLFVICTQDAVCMREMMNPAKEQGLVPHLKEVVVDAAHWSPMEKPDEIARHIKDFLIDIPPCC
ncbi:Alpha/Beta hydrolase protein [Aspergillus californicus]